ncbi:MAG: uracil-DNA glycosylase [Tepidanaerobacteraceae bacterium]|jgi:DNA polymerase|nr:uracil-DNA glycosylase [Tepidanaerobacteraceae bacterium]
MAELDNFLIDFEPEETQLPYKIKLMFELKKEFNLSEIHYGKLIDIIKAENAESDNIREYLYDKIKEYLNSCIECSLHSSDSCTKKVPGEGCMQSPLMLIGEGPGFDEDRLGRPFVGRAGQLLTTILEKLNINRQRLYISNVVKCRPPKNRTPFANEIKACSRNLELELSFISPKVIIALGSVPLNYFKPHSSIIQERGKWIYTRNLWIMPTFHPAYILRQQGKALNKTKWDVWLDFNNALAKVKELCPDYSFK